MIFSGALPRRIVYLRECPANGGNNRKVTITQLRAAAFPRT